MPGHNGAAAKAIQRSASTFKDLTGRGGRYMEEDIRVASMGEISAYAKECVDATLHPGVLAAGAQKQSRRSASTRVTYRNRLRQAEVGRAILEDRAMRSAAPLPPALVESQASMLRNIHEAQARGGAAASKLRSRVAVVVAAHRLTTGAARAKQLRDGALLRRFRVCALAMLAAQCLLAGPRKQGGTSRGPDNAIRAAVDQCRAMLAARMPDILKPASATKAAARATGATTPATSTGAASRPGSRPSGGGGAAASAAVGAKAKADFVKIGAAVADMLRETNMPTLGQSDSSHSHGHNRNSGGGGSAEVWLFEHSQRSVDVQSLSASALHPDLYAFAANLPRGKARERRDRCVAYLKRAVEGALNGVGNEASAMVAKGIFHPDANRQRALAASRVALLEALDLPKADEKVLREMKGEHEIKEAEDKVEGARVAAVGAKAEREDWEGRQREALAEMRLDQLKDRAVALDLEMPSASHRLKLDLIEGILDVRRRLRFPRAPSGRFEADESEEAARMACEEVKAAVEAARLEAQAGLQKKPNAPSRLSKTTAAAREAEEAAAALAQDRRRVREERRAKMTASIEGAHQEAMSALAASSNSGPNGSGAKRQEDLKKHRRRALEAKKQAAASSSSSRGSGGMDEEMTPDPPVASGMLSLSGMQPVVVPRSVLLHLTEERVQRQQVQLAHAAEAQRLEQEQRVAIEVEATKAAEVKAKKRAEERALLGFDGDGEIAYEDNDEGEDPRDLFTVRSSEQSTTIAGHKHPELADGASLSSRGSSQAPHDRRGSRNGGGGVNKGASNSNPLAFTWGNDDEDLPPAWARNGRASPDGPLVENTDDGAADAFWRARVSGEPSTAASKKKHSLGRGSRHNTTSNNDDDNINSGSANNGGGRRKSGSGNLADLADVSSFQATHDRLLRRSNLDQQSPPGGSSSTNNGHSSPNAHGRSEELPAVNTAGGPALIGATLSSSMRRGGSPLAASLHPKGALALQPPSLSKRELQAQEEENRRGLVEWQRAHKKGGIGVDESGVAVQGLEKDGRKKEGEQGDNDSVVSGGNSSVGGGGANGWAADEPLPPGSRARLYTPGAPLPPPTKQLPAAGPMSAESAMEVTHAAGKLHKPLRHTNDTRKRTAALFEALEMPTEKQLAFLTRYSASFGDTARLDDALSAWESAAALVRLREYTLARLALLEKGHWLEPFELFDRDQERSLRQVSAWVMRPTPMLFGAPPNAAEKAQAAAAEEQANADALSVPFDPNSLRPGSRSGSRSGARGRSSMDVPSGAGFTRDDDGNVTPTSPTSAAERTFPSGVAAAVAAVAPVAAAAEGPSVGSTLTQPTPVETDLWDVQKSRELQRLATVNWLRRILSRITRHATKALQLCEDRFGDAVSFQGRDYAATINAAGAV